LDESYGNGKGQIFGFSDSIVNENYNNISASINFPTSGQTVGTFSWSSKRTLSQIEQMTGYSVKPRGVVSNYKNGGYVVYEVDGHGLVMSISDIGKFNWNDAKTASDELNLNGYNDWRLPSRKELELIYGNMFKLGIGKLTSGYYWSSEEKSATKARVLLFYNGNYHHLNKNSIYYVRAVRAF
jgi:lysozyme family protein